MLKSFDYYNQVKDPIVYLCNPDRKCVGVINATDRNIMLRFNDLCELTFVVSEPINDGLSGNTMTVYDKVCAKRLVYVEDIGWFQIGSVNEEDDGQYRYKNVTCQSYQITLNNLSITTEERVYLLFNEEDPLDELYDYKDDSAVPSIIGQLYQQLGILVDMEGGDLSQEKDYEQWTITHISDKVKGDNAIYRTMEDTTDFGYDFIKNKVAESYDVVFEFDFLHHTINVEKISELTKATNIYLSFDNLVNEISLEENSDDIVTVLSCEGNGVDITMVNPMGTNYIVNFDHYMQELENSDGTKEYPWMSKELIDTINAWKIAYNESKSDYERKVIELESLEKDLVVLEQDRELASIKLSELESAIGGEDGFMVVEEVALGEKSLKDGTTFYAAPFDSFATLKCYQDAPEGTRDSAGIYEFAFKADAESKTGTLQSMIEDYLPVASSADKDASCYLYFMDGDKYSYCKMTIDSEVVVSKDSAGASAKIDGSADRYLTLKDGTIFTLKKNGDSFVIYDKNSSRIAPDKTGVFTYDGGRFRVLKTVSGYVTLYYYYISGFTRYTSLVIAVMGDDDESVLKGWRSVWSDKKQMADFAREGKQAEVDAVKATLTEISKTCNVQEYIKSRGGDTLYNEFSHYWIEARFQNDSIAVGDDPTVVEVIELSRELMETGVVELEKVSQPTYNFSVNAVNFTNLIEFKTFTDQLELGRVITIEKKEGELFKPALVSIGFSLDEPESFSLEFSNSSKINDSIMTYADLVKSSSQTCRTVAANWSYLTQYQRDKDELFSLTKNPLDRTLRAVQGNLINQEFTVDNTGILGRKWSDDTHISFDDEQVRIVNNTIVFTDDDWRSSKTALGKVAFDYYDSNGNKIEKSAYGLLADVVVGSLVMGENIQIRNSNNTILLDENGITIKQPATEDGEEAKTVFSATTKGDLFVTGAIHATSLTLDNSVQIPTSSIEGINELVDEKLGASLSLYIKKPDGYSEDENNSNNLISVLEGRADIINFKGNTISIKSNNFNLTKYGDLNASNAIISGEITAKRGTFGDLKINVLLEDEKISLIRATTGDVLSSSAVLELTGYCASYTIDRDTPIASVMLGGRLTNTVGCDYALSNGNKRCTIYLWAKTPDTEVGLISATIKYAGSTYIEAGDGAFRLEGTDNDTALLTVEGADIGTLFANSLSVANQAYISEIEANTVSTDCIMSRDGRHTIFVEPTEHSTYILSVSCEATSNYVTVTASKALLYDHSVRVWYRPLGLWWRKKLTVTIPAGESSVKAISSAVNGIAEAGFIDSNGDELDGDKTIEGRDFSRAHFTINSSFLPSSTDAYLTLGDGTHQWNDIYSVNSHIGSSDEKLKKDILPLSDKYDKMFDGLIPITFRYINNNSERLHTGLTAQNLKQAIINAGLTTNDCAAYCEWENEAGDIECGIRYGELTSINIYEIQKLKKRVAELEKELQELKEK